MMVHPAEVGSLQMPGRSLTVHAWYSRGPAKNAMIDGRPKRIAARPLRMWPPTRAPQLENCGVPVWAW